MSHVRFEPQHFDAMESGVATTETSRPNVQLNVINSTEMLSNPNWINLWVFIDFLTN